MPENRFRDTSLDFDERVSALLAELTTDEKLGLLTTHMNAVPRLGIKEFWIGAEVARGLVCRDSQGEYPSTVFPEPFGLAATFDTGVMKRMGEVTGVENRIYTQKGKSSLCVWGPTVDLERDGGGTRKPTARTRALPEPWRQRTPAEWLAQTKSTCGSFLRSSTSTPTTTRTPA